MKVNVLFFGATADTAGTRSEEIEVETGQKSSEAFARILDDRPALARHRLHYSVNQSYASGDEILEPGDELAIFTAVSGG